MKDLKSTATLACKDTIGITHIMPIKDISVMYRPAVHPDNYTDIKKSIKEQGLQFPIVLLEMSLTEWAMTAENQPEDILPPPDILGDRGTVWMCMCGNNRLAIARELGYEHIEAYRCHSKEEVNKLCGTQRKHWRIYRNAKTTGDFS